MDNFSSRWATHGSGHSGSTTSTRIQHDRHERHDAHSRTYLTLCRRTESNSVLPYPIAVQSSQAAPTIGDGSCNYGFEDADEGVYGYALQAAVCSLKSEV